MGARGLRLNALPDLAQMSPRVCVQTVDFRTAERRHIPLSKTMEVKAACDGIVHAVVASWEVWSHDHMRRITTHFEDTKDASWGLARDMQWGQGLQLIEDIDAGSGGGHGALPAPFVVEAGEQLSLTVRFSRPCRHELQFR